jgi:hypothetical protein
MLVGEQPKGEQTICAAEGQTKTAELDKKVSDLDRTWHPSGYYSPEQMLAIVDEVYKLGREATARLDKAPRSTGDASIWIRNQLNDTRERIWGKGLAFTTAANTAKTQGIKIVDAPGLKDWVRSAMLSASSAFATAYTYECVVTDFQKLAISLSWMRDLFDKAIAFIKKIVGVVIAVGAAILHIPEAVGGAISYLKWGAVAGVGIWVFLELRKRTKSA